ncbi:hypothetical protein ZWY2020_005071 [Hordeum vulgare]|nr:hypothetical protein ZWY2020_005071 [Hordeum vulgare]
MEVYNAMSADGAVPTVRTYYVLMLTFGKRRDTETVVGLLGEMDARGVRPNVYSYTICIRVLGQAGRLEEAYRILCKMKEEGCKPDVVTNTVLIQILCDAGQLDDAKDVFWKMKASDQKPDRVTYTTLLDKCGTDGDSRYELMKSKGIVPDVVAGNVVLYGLAKSGRLVMAKRVFHELKAMGISPDNITYTMMIRCCSKASNVDEAMKIFAEMIENRRLPCSLIDMVYKAWEMKPRIFYELKEMNLEPTDCTYNTLLAGLGREGKVKEVMQLLEGMNSYSFPPNIITYNSVYGLSLQKWGGELYTGHAIQYDNERLHA